MIKINVHIKNKSWKKIILSPEIYLKKKVKKLNAFDRFFKNKNLEFSILLSGNSEIRNLNKKFRKKNRITDVLSFPFQKKKILLNLLKKKNLVYLGDIVVNLNRINSIDNKNKIKKNFDKLWIHAFLHLLGFRHKLNKDYLKMRKVENKFLKLVS
jgi:probable rRNA maturation factor